MSVLTKLNTYLAILSRAVKSQGIQGEKGSSAYQIALDSGFEGTPAQWMESIHVKGVQGERGITGPKGDRGLGCRYRL